MFLADPPSTCLSSTVHYMVCEAGFEMKASYAVSSVICSTGEIDWGFIAKQVQYGEQDSTLDYIKSVRSLGPLCESIHLHLKSLTVEQFENQFVMWLQWTNCSEIFLEMFDTVRSPCDAAVALSLMKLTSCLERALGDVFLLIGKDCPFLLRDLLASQELVSIFGQPVMDILKVFIGSPDGLNLRNILWHGFVSAEEIPVKYFSMLLFLTAGLGQLLNNYCLQTQSTLVHRPYVSFTNLKELHIFPDLNHKLLSLAGELVTKSNIVLKTMLPFWTAAITSFQQGRYADCVILLLPQLEGGLRVLFTAVNKCPSRLMTAESSSLYTTFDEILAKQLNNEEMNQLPIVLGESAMEFFWDFLNHQEGPRVRDHLSHGEIILSHFPREIANSMLSFSITLLCRFSQDDLAAIKDHEFLKLLMTCANNYCTKFHPITQLKKQILNCIKSITSWPDFPVVSEEQDKEMTGSGKDTAPCILLISDISSQLQPYLSVNVTLLGDPVNNLLTEKLLTELCSKHIHTLFCPRSVLEIIVVLRQISTQCHHVSCQVISVCETRYKQWINKSLRSRQRLNFLRMRRSIKFLSPVLQLVLILITLELVNIHTICKKTTFEYQQYLKFLKLILQYIENLATYTSPEKNKWDETMVLTHKSLIKIKTFVGRELMLVQLAETKNIISPHQNSVGLT
ncbi:endoplasmic reticulum membrane-associated RNA degradation protein isoform X1 [Python bivittatus]|uniref:Endoplasmic reticulum membrane-associated RNA degradation protein isoform X1 n=1 Tax=Python bivittatus TaxID=176946 RepID=A0A9F2R6T0_PYTBI|nr:endoplasmic reticulum membrane-associated RNA degradation protein isoform X1 [Python bivittatus]XP_007437263.1 endoplasmic reticulum membrane-associated RNA degradation protein isoform X1 [Python bivittatus]